MYRRLLPLLTASLLFASAAPAASFTATTDTLLGGLTNGLEATSNVTTNVFDSKLVLAAREDAAHFVASDGERRGARLEAALTHIRARAPELEASDLQLARAILTL